MRLSLRRFARWISISWIFICCNYVIFFHKDLAASVFDKDARVSDGDIREGIGSVGKPVAFAEDDGRAGRLRRAMSVSDDRNKLEFNKLKGHDHLGGNGVGPTIKETELSDIFISVKTTIKNHQKRVKILLETWVNLAREETYFFSDTDDPELKNVKRGHLINTNCSASHTRKALCCKMSVEYDYFMLSEKRWFCHFDDDIYINIPQLVKTLRKYKHTEDWYLGKPSIRHPIETLDRDHPGMKISYWFATGAGFCISRGLGLKMMPYASGGRFQTQCAKSKLPDDCTMGYIIDFLMKKKLTHVSTFRSHLEGLTLLDLEDLKNQITISYKSNGSSRNNAVRIGGFSDKEDPTRFKSVHCYLYPYMKDCPPDLKFEATNQPKWHRGEMLYR